MAGALAGFIIGLALWTFVTMILVAGVDDALGSESDAGAAARAAQERVFDCSDFGAVRVLSAEDEARYQSQCGVQQPVIESETVTLTTSAQNTGATATNRADCGKIRGTDYRSDEERTWFLAECVTQ